MGKPILNKFQPKHEYKDYKFTIPKGGYYQFTLQKDGKTYRQTVLAPSLKEAQDNLNPDMWEQL